jgi:signal peptidase II
MQAEGRAPLSGDEAASTGPVAPPDTAPALPIRHRRLGLLLAVAVAVVIADQVSKAVIVAVIPQHGPVRLLGGLVTVTYTRNPGAAFSLGTGFTLLFTAVAVAVVVTILRTARRLYSTGWAVALGGLLGGAIGNLTDRLTRAPGIGRGHVVDWIQLPHFAVFNLADAAICCSAAGMVLLTLLGRDIDGTRHPRHPSSP